MSLVLCLNTLFGGLDTLLSFQTPDTNARLALDEKSYSNIPLYRLRNFPSEEKPTALRSLIL